MWYKPADKKTADQVKADAKLYREMLKAAKK